MLHTQIEPRERETFFYPASNSMPAVAPAARRARALSNACHQQMHPAVYKIALACWLSLLGIFVVTFFSSTETMFILAVDGMYAVMFFGIPWVFHRIAPEDKTGPRDFFNFLNGRFDTIDGPIPAGEAALQVFLVPLCLSLGGIAIAFIIHAAQLAY